MHVLCDELQQYNTYIAHSELCIIVSVENLMLPEENLLITHESLLWRAVPIALAKTHLLDISEPAQTLW